MVMWDIGPCKSDLFVARAGRHSKIERSEDGVGPLRLVTTVSLSFLRHQEACQMLRVAQKLDSTSAASHGLVSRIFTWAGEPKYQSCRIGRYGGLRQNLDQV